MLGPVTDGVLLPDTVRALISEADPKPEVPLLLGCTRDEGALPVAAMVIAEGFNQPPEAWAHRRFGEVAGEAIVSLYDTAWYPTCPIGGLGITPERRVIVEIINDGLFYRSAGHLSEDRACTNGRPVYVYHYLPTRVSAVTGIAGAAHGEEVPLLFGSVNNPDTQEQLLIDALQGYWAGFAHTGVPGATGYPAWPAFEPGTRSYLELDLGDTPDTIAMVRSDYLEFGDAGDWRPDHMTKSELITVYDEILAPPYVPPLGPWDLAGVELMSARFNNFFSWQSDPCWSTGQPVEDNVPDQGDRNRVARASACTGDEVLSMRNSAAIDTSSFCQVTLGLWVYLDGELDPGDDHLDIEVEDDSGWVLLERLDSAAETWLYQIYDLTPHRHTAMRIRFVTNVDGADEDVALDDVTITGFTGCP
jgi:hypothetical protein